MHSTQESNGNLHPLMTPRRNGKLPDNTSENGQCRASTNGNFHPFMLITSALLQCRLPANPVGSCQAWRQSLRIPRKHPASTNGFMPGPKAVFGSQRTFLKVPTSGKKGQSSVCSPGASSRAPLVTTDSEPRNLSAQTKRKHF